MSPAEKLMATAMGCIERGQTENKFCGQDDVRQWCAQLNIAPHSVWEMACYVFVFRRPQWEQDAIRRDRAWDELPPIPVGVC